MKPESSMHEGLIAYFLAEKRESLLFMGAGVAALLASILLFRSSSPYRGMIGPLALIALIQLGVGGAVYFRTDAQIAELTALLEKDPPAYVAKELPRMEKVSSSFTTYKFAEIALLAAGIAMTFLFRGRDVPYSIGVGLIIQPSLMLVLDLFAERRADVYIEQIKALAGG
jgi:hypothetical protein